MTDADPFDVVLTACREAHMTYELILGGGHYHHEEEMKKPRVAISNHPAIHHPVRDFTAVTMCPGCGEIGVFGLHEPPDEDTTPQPAKATVTTYGGEVARVIGGTHHRTDKTTCDVIRECPKCHARWGEK